jgi:rubrerythrin
MAEFESYEEILELAISREIDAYKFFTIMAARSLRPELHNVFEELAAEELEHKAKLELEIMKAGRVVKNTEHPELKAEDDEVVIAKLDMDYKHMLRLCIQKEDASFRIYVDLAGKVTNEESYETFLALAEEELKHKMRFETEYEALMKAGEAGLSE